MHYDHSQHRQIVSSLLIVENQYACFLFRFQGHKLLLLEAGQVHRVVKEMSAATEQFKSNWQPYAISLPWVNWGATGKGKHIQGHEEQSDWLTDWLIELPKRSLASSYRQREQTTAITKDTDKSLVSGPKRLFQSVLYCCEVSPWPRQLL